MQSVLHLDDRTVAELVDPALPRSVPSTTPSRPGAVARRRRRNGSGRRPDGGMASAMAAVVPPYCGGKLYATNAGRFTFLNALFHTDGTLLATLDGDAVTLLRTAAASSLAIRHLAAPACRRGRRHRDRAPGLAAHRDAAADAPRTGRTAHLRAPTVRRPTNSRGRLHDAEAHVDRAHRPARRRRWRPRCRHRDLGVGAAVSRHGDLRRHARSAPSARPSTTEREIDPDARRPVRGGGVRRRRRDPHRVR